MTFPPSKSGLLLMSFAGLAALVGVGRASELRSPFLPSSAQDNPAALEPGASLEYRAAIDLGDGWQFRVVDPSRKLAAWARLNEPDSDLHCTVKHHEQDPDREAIVVEREGREYTLPLRQPKVLSNGAFASRPVAPASGRPPIVSPAIINTVVVNPTSQQEIDRMNALIAEVKRRREEREQAAQPPNQTPSLPSSDSAAPLR